MPGSAGGAGGGGVGSLGGGFGGDGAGPFPVGVVGFGLFDGPTTSSMSSSSSGSPLEDLSL